MSIGDAWSNSFTNPLEEDTDTTAVVAEQTKPRKRGKRKTSVNLTSAQIKAVLDRETAVSEAPEKVRSLMATIFSTENETEALTIASFGKAPAGFALIDSFEGEDAFAVTALISTLDKSDQKALWGLLINLGSDIPEKQPSGMEGMIALAKAVTDADLSELDGVRNLLES